MISNKYEGTGALLHTNTHTRVRFYIVYLACCFLGQKSRSLASGMKLTFDDSCCESLSGSTSSLRDQREEGDTEHGGKGARTCSSCFNKAATITCLTSYIIL